MPSRSHRNRSLNSMSVSYVLNDSEEDNSDNDNGDTEHPHGPCPGSQQRKQSSGVTRPARPTYTDEEEFFIWYHRIDLGLPWNMVTQRFDKQFPARRPKGGLQCKLYRVLEDWNLPQLRQQLQSNGGNGEIDKRYGVIQQTDRRFVWMTPEDQRKGPPANMLERAPSSKRGRHRR